MPHFIINTPHCRENVFRSEFLSHLRLDVKESRETVGQVVAPFICNPFVTKTEQQVSQH